LVQGSVLLAITPHFFYESVFHPDNPVRCAGVAVVRNSDVSAVMFSFSFLLLNQWKEEQIGTLRLPALGSG
jgi:hypothetical protein